MSVVIQLSSEEHGTEEFSYPSMSEARKGMNRLSESIEQRRDGVLRTVSLIIERRVFPAKNGVFRETL